MSAWTEKIHPSNSFEEGEEWFKQQVLKQLQQGGLFEDPLFPANDETLGEGLIKGGNDFEWLRPGEISDDPQFVAGGMDRFDTLQGKLGDCWFLSSVGSLTLHPDLVNQVVPKEQSFSSDDYCGMFWFRIWRFGQWCDVVVDDRLPTKNKKLVFMHSTDGNEFWSALLQKAYTKLVGSYYNMIGGRATEALEDLTGGICEEILLQKNAPDGFFKILHSSFARQALMAIVRDHPKGEREKKPPHGLVNGHAYSVTGITRLNTSDGEVELVRIRNPWGNSLEWTGPWSDKSEEWKTVSDEDRASINQVCKGDGEFWISFPDMMTYFTRIMVCNVDPARDPDEERLATRRWELKTEEGEWILGRTDGGNKECVATFHKNPQFCITVVDPDDADDDDTGSIVVGLMQIIQRKDSPHYIGYAIYRLDDDCHSDGPFGKDFFEGRECAAESEGFFQLREVVGRHSLAPGRYVIVPSTNKPNRIRKFKLRIYSEVAAD